MQAIPEPVSDEFPAAYAYRVGQWYLSSNQSDKSVGQFFTSLPVARFMAQSLLPHNGTLRVLDPGAGAGILACALCESWNNDLEIEACEVDEQRWKDLHQRWQNTSVTNVIRVSKDASKNL